MLLLSIGTARLGPASAEALSCAVLLPVRLLVQLPAAELLPLQQLAPDPFGQRRPANTMVAMEIRKA